MAGSVGWALAGLAGDAEQALADAQVDVMPALLEREQAGDEREEVPGGGRGVDEDASHGNVQDSRTRVGGVARQAVTRSATASRASATERPPSRRSTSHSSMPQTPTRRASRLARAAGASAASSRAKAASTHSRWARRPPAAASARAGEASSWRSIRSVLAPQRS